MFDARRIILVAHLVLSTGAVTDSGERNVAAAGMVTTRVDDSSLTESGEISERALGIKLKRRRQLKKSKIEYFDKYLKLVNNNPILRYSHLFFWLLPLPIYISGIFMINSESYGNIFPTDDIFDFHKALANAMSPFLFSSTKEDSSLSVYDYVQLIFLSLNLIHFSFVFVNSSSNSFRIVAACAIASQLFFIILNALIRFSPDYIKEYVEKKNDGLTMANLLHRTLIVVSLLVYVSGWFYLTFIGMMARDPNDKKKYDACKAKRRDYEFTEAIRQAMCEEQKKEKKAGAKRLKAQA